MFKKLFKVLSTFYVIFSYITNVNAISESEPYTLYALACENITNNTPKSAIRLKAADKAIFEALDKSSFLSEYKNTYETHDFNVLVYSLADNYLEDVSTRTTFQDEDKLCVEITGYLYPQNIEFALAEIKEQQTYPEKLELEIEALTPPSPTSLPPKPKVKIKADIAVENIYKDNVTNKQTRVYIDKTMFSNNTSSNAFHFDISNEISENSNVIITDKTSNADYLIKTKVLRAKVDPINKQTNRMQMVVSLELINVADSTSIVEHQNRFVLFESSENEQTIASSLLKKLLRKAARQISSKIKDKYKTSGSIITPNVSLQRN